VIPFFLEQRKTGVLPITDPNMTRFNISLDEGVDMVLWAISNSVGGEVFVPKIPSYRVVDVATAIGPECRQQVVGIRPGEKLHEEMITASDSVNTVDLGRYYAILPADSKIRKHYLAQAGVKEVLPGFCYDSGNNTSFLSVTELRDLIRRHVSAEAL
jgi:FlaA1/EpsC-like NDP-sugar epimerase